MSFKCDDNNNNIEVEEFQYGIHTRLKNHRDGQAVESSYPHYE